MLISLGDILLDNGRNGSGPGSNNVSCSPVPCLAAVLAADGIRCVPTPNTRTCVAQAMTARQPCPPCYIMRDSQCAGPAANYAECISAIQLPATPQTPGGNSASPSSPSGLDECTKKILFVGAIGLAALVFLFRMLE